jgi:hypothetical protein
MQPAIAGHRGPRGPQRNLMVTCLLILQKLEKVLEVVLLFPQSSKVSHFSSECYHLI